MPKKAKKPQPKTVALDPDLYQKVIAYQRDASHGPVGALTVKQALAALVNKGLAWETLPDE